MMDVMFAQMGGLSEIFGMNFFSVVLPWLLTFAIVYGILGQVKIPQSNPPRVIIGVVLAFLVAPTLAPFMNVLMEMVGEFMILIGGLLVFIILLEVLGVKSKKYKPPKNEEEAEKIKKGEKKPETEEFSVFEAHGKTFAAIFGILAILVFIGSGAPEALGWNIPTEISSNFPLLFFFGFIALMVWWMAIKE